MPREHQKRGRRGEPIKRKRSDDVAPEDSTAKKAKHYDTTQDFETPLDFIPLDDPRDGDAQPADDTASTGRPFYGVLDEQEQEYFKRADEMLELNNFESQEERDIFVCNLQKEAQGKELKLACSQSCSRLLERLLAVSGPEDLAAFLKAFQGQFVNLIQHRFASHCCETLIKQCGRHALRKGESAKSSSTKGGPVDREEMQGLLCAISAEFEDGFGYLMTDKFASHVLRVYLAVLAGISTDSSSTTSLLHSKKKEEKSSSSHELKSDATAVPDSFRDTLISIVSSCVDNLDASYTRALSTHPTGNPILQLIVQLQLGHFGKSYLKGHDTILNKLLSDAPIVEGSEGASFVLGLAYDPIGSRLLEVIVQYVPGKTFKALFNNLLKSRMATMARNEIAGYIVCRVLERLSPEDVLQAQKELLPSISLLAQRGRTSVLKVLAERSVARDVDTTELCAALRSAYADEEGQFSIAKVLELPDEVTAESAGREVSQQPSKGFGGRQHAAAAFLRGLLALPGEVSKLVLDSLSRLPTAAVQYLATTSAYSPVLQDALTTPAANPIFRRKISTRLYGMIGQLAVSTSGSFVVDALEAGTRKGLAFVRERVAEELAENEEELRRSVPGRKVWRNWRMDLYQRNRGEWVRTTRRDVGNDGFQSLPGLLGQDSDGSSAMQAGPTAAGAEEGQSSTMKKKTTANKVGNNGGKTALQLARERHARKVAASKQEQQSR